MSTAVLHRLIDGRWRVTDAPDDWVDDGRDYPAPKATDAVYETSGRRGSRLSGAHDAARPVG